MQTKQFNRWIKQQLLPALPEFANSGHGDMFCVPMNHLFRGFAFSGSSYSSTSFRINTLIQPLYVPADCITLEFARRLRTNSGSDTWEWDAASEEKVMQDLKAVITSAGIPFFDKIRQPSDLADAALSMTTVTTNTQEAIAYSLIWAERFSEAMSHLQAVCENVERSTSRVPLPTKGLHGLWHGRIAITNLSPCLKKAHHLPRPN